MENHNSLIEAQAAMNLALQSTGTEKALVMASAAEFVRAFNVAHPDCSMTITENAAGGLRVDVWPSVEVIKRLRTLELLNLEDIR